MASFKDRVAIVTGAGRGLGRAYSLELSQRGAAVLVNDTGGSVGGSGQDRKVTDDVVEEIRRSGGEAAPSYDSVATKQGGQAIVEKAMSEFGQVDIVINNAGISRPASILSMDAEDFEEVIRVHLLGAFYVSQPAYRAMREHRFGRFVFTSSNVGVFGRAGRPNYAAAKAGVLGLCSSIALEGASHGILANVILPMAITRMAGDRSQIRAAVNSDVLPRSFAERFDPVYVTQLVVALCSENCPVTNGVFSAGGGHFAKVFTGLTSGWTASSPSQTKAEELLEHWNEVESHESFSVPSSFQDEIDSVTRRLNRSVSTNEAN